MNPLARIHRIVARQHKRNPALLGMFPSMLFMVRGLGEPAEEVIWTDSRIQKTRNYAVSTPCYWSRRTPPPYGDGPSPRLQRARSTRISLVTSELPPSPGGARFASSVPYGPVKGNTAGQQAFANMTIQSRHGIVGVEAATNLSIRLPAILLLRNTFTLQANLQQ